MGETGNKRLLLVEDEFLIRMTLTEALEDDGYQVLEAGSGDEALEMLHNDDGVQLLLTDIQLPGSLDGLALGEAARALRGDLPIIYMTGRPDSVPSGIASDRQVFMAKPYLPSEVARLVRQLIG